MVVEIYLNKIFVLQLYLVMENKCTGKPGSAARDQYEHELSMGILGHQVKKARQEPKLTSSRWAN